MTSDHVIIVAGGSGTRLESEIPKQFLKIGSLPILMRTIYAFSEARTGINIIVVLPKDQYPYWSQLCNEHNFSVAHKVVTGGATRFQSVRNGLDAISIVGLVGIHDGVRPFVPAAVINAAFEAANLFGNAVVAVQSKDSLRVKSGITTKSVNRSDYFSVQTPQVFRIGLIKKAFQVVEQPFFTDDASVLEYSGQKVNLVEGSYQNIKITTKEDLIFAECLIKMKP
jgi:2-C-methyl-D-erythritol 4-phosphate cytidylyltransferase